MAGLDPVSESAVESEVGKAYEGKTVKAASKSSHGDASGCGRWANKRIFKLGTD